MFLHTGAEESSNCSLDALPNSLHSAKHHRTAPFSDSLQPGGQGQDAADLVLHQPLQHHPSQHAQQQQQQNSSEAGMQPCKFDASPLALKYGRSRAATIHVASHPGFTQAMRQRGLQKPAKKRELAGDWRALQAQLWADNSMGLQAGLPGTDKRMTPPDSQSQHPFPSLDPSFDMHEDMCLPHSMLPDAPQDASPNSSQPQQTNCSGDHWQGHANDHVSPQLGSGTGSSSHLPQRLSPAYAPLSASPEDASRGELWDMMQHMLPTNHRASGNIVGNCNEPVVSDAARHRPSSDLRQHALDIVNSLWPRAEDQPPASHASVQQDLHDRDITAHLCANRHCRRDLSPCHLSPSPRMQADAVRQLQMVSLNGLQERHPRDPNQHHNHKGCVPEAGSLRQQQMNFSSPHAMRMHGLGAIAQSTHAGAGLMPEPHKVAHSPPEPTVAPSRFPARKSQQYSNNDVDVITLQDVRQQLLSASNTQSPCDPHNGPTATSDQDQSIDLPALQSLLASRDSQHLKLTQLPAFHHERSDLLQAPQAVANEFRSGRPDGWPLARDAGSTLDYHLQGPVEGSNRDLADAAAFLSEAIAQGEMLLPAMPGMQAQTSAYTRQQITSMPTRQHQLADMDLARLPENRISFMASDRERIPLSPFLAPPIIDPKSSMNHAHICGQPYLCHTNALAAAHAELSPTHAQSRHHAPTGRAKQHNGPSNQAHRSPDGLLEIEPPADLQQAELHAHIHGQRARRNPSQQALASEACMSPDQLTGEDLGSQSERSIHLSGQIVQRPHEVPSSGVSSPSLSPQGLNSTPSLSNGHSSPGQEGQRAGHKRQPVPLRRVSGDENLDMGTVPGKEQPRKKLCSPQKQLRVSSPRLSTGVPEGGSATNGAMKASQQLKALQQIERVCQAQVRRCS